MEARRKLTKPGPLREGFDFQDAYALLRFVEWLEKPAKYQWMKLEANEAGYLDDLIAVSTQDSCSLFQIKYGVHPDTPSASWTWKSLLTGKSKQTATVSSLFAKWFRSWADYGVFSKAEKHTTAYLVTNRIGSSELLRCCEQEPKSLGFRIDPAKLKKQNSKHYREAKQIAGSELALKQFLKCFVLLFDQQELNELLETSRRRLQDLGVDERGYRGLRDAIRRWATSRDEPISGGTILLSDIHNAAGWNKLRPLDQRFPVPKDFVLFDEVIHRRVLANLKLPQGGVNVFVGSPASGKSTYLSHLYRTLKQNGIPCVRHHYFIQLGTTDPDYYKRLKPDAANETLLHDLLETAAFSLGEYANRNPHPNELADYIKRSAAYFHAQGKSLVLIVDGLDHVTRESDKKNLRVFLEELLPVPAGLWLILGTRPLSHELLPELVYEACPETAWIAVNGFGEQGCKRFLRFHRVELQIPVDPEDYFDRVVAAFYEKSQGHPFYSRRLLEVLRRRLSGSFVLDREIAELPPFPGNMLSVYKDLWRQVGPESQQVATLIAVAGLKLSSPQIVECLGGTIESNAAVLRSLQELKPYIKEERGAVTFFHSSFDEFIRQTPEFRQLGLFVLQRLRDWLTIRAPEYHKWAHLFRVEYMLGNPAPILAGISRSWLVDAIYQGREFQDITHQLELATHAAMQADNYSHAHLVGVNIQYIEWMSHEDIWDDVWFLSWKNGLQGTKELPREYDLDGRSPAIVCELSKKAEETRNRFFQKRCFDSLNTRLSQLRLPNSDFSDDWINFARHLCQAHALARLKPSPLVKWIARTRRIGRSAEVIHAYASALAWSHQNSRLRELISHRLPADEKSAVREGVAETCITSGRKTLPDLGRSTSSGRGPWTLTFMSLTGQRLPRKSRAMPPRDSFRDPTREHLTKLEEQTLMSQFRSVFALGLVNGIHGDLEIVNKWTSITGVETWTHRAAKTLAKVGVSYGSAIANGGVPQFEDFLKIRDSFDAPSWPKNREIWGAWKVLQSFLMELVTQTANIRSWLGHREGLSLSLARAMRTSEFWARRKMIILLAKGDQTLMPKTDLQEFLAEEELFWASEVTYFSERAEVYRDLATVAFKSNLEDEGKSFLKAAAENLVGYGFHKDLYAYEILRTVESCHEAGSSAGESLLRRLAPIVQAIPQFTDGDETRDLPEDFANVLRKINPRLLAHYYVECCRKEWLFLADHVFSELVDSLDYSDPIASAIGSTAIDLASFKKLKERANGGDQHARPVLTGLTEFFRDDEPFTISRSSRDEESSGRAKLFPDANKNEERLEDISPQEIEKQIALENTRRDKQRILASWLRIWLKRVERRQEVYEIAKKWLSSTDSTLVDAEIYDALVPLAQEFDGEDQAFEYLCLAFEKSYGWSWYSHRIEEVNGRWTKLLEDFPGHWREFIRKTRTVERYGFPPNRMTYLPVLRGAQFLIRAQALSEAESLTRAAVGALEQLTANLKFPPVDWLVPTFQADLWDVLFSRLTWPNPVVRERAARAIAQLLQTKESQNSTLERIIGQLKKVVLESETPLFLLPIIRTVRIDPMTLDIDFVELENSISRPSVLSDILLAQIKEAVGLK
jgi:NACHT domain